MDSRIFLYVNFFKKIVRSHLRLTLTLSGMVLSVIILLIGFAFSETYFSSNYAAIDYFKHSKVSLVSGDYDYELYRNIADLEHYSAALELVSPYTYPVLKGDYNGQEIQVSVKDIRTNNIDCNMLLAGENSLNRYSGKLLYGRLLNEADIEQKSNVVVINEALADLLFGITNAVGEKISIPVYQLNYQTGTMGISYYEELLVVGVVSASDAQNKEIARITSSDDTTAMVASYVYVPLSLVIAEKDTKSYNMTVLSYNDDEQSYNNSLWVLSDAVNESGNGSNYSIRNYYTLGTQINSVVRTTKSSLVSILIFLFLASGLLIVNTMFFSVKERINEIGIRKAIGAFGSDIVKQFVFEGFVYGAISACIGIVLGLCLGSVIYIILDLKTSWNVHLKLSADTIALCVIIPVIVGTVSSVLPALYASKIKITDAVKSE